MRIGIQSGANAGDANGIQAAVDTAKRLEAMGFSTFSMANIFGLDALGTLTVVGWETERIELATGVVPTYPRHPMAMAQQALTCQAASNGRFVLGIGLSHQIVIEGMFGYSYAKPARHMREYLEVLVPLLAGEAVRFKGSQYQVQGQLQVEGAARVPVLVAALGPVMLGLAGRLADGTVTWMTGPKTLGGHIGPTLREAAKAAGKPDPRIVAGFPIALTRDPDGARRQIDQQLQIYGQLPSYRAMLDHEGAAGPGDVALVGDEAALRARLRHLREIGVTDFQAVPMEVEPGASERTLELLAALNQETSS